MLLRFECSCHTRCATALVCTKCAELSGRDFFPSHLLSLADWRISALRGRFVKAKLGLSEASSVATNRMRSPLQMPPLMELGTVPQQAQPSSALTVMTKRAPKEFS